MRNSLAWIVAATIWLATSASANAQWRSAKWELSTFAGYETRGSFPVFNSTTVNRLRANGDLSFGTFIDYRLTENAQVEFMWNRNQTSYSERQAATGIYTRAFNSDIDQYQFGLLYMLRGSDNK